jgi:hypothetical protein
VIDQVPTRNVFRWKCCLREPHHTQKLGMHFPVYKLISKVECQEVHLILSLSISRVRNPCLHSRAMHVSQRQVLLMNLDHSCIHPLMAYSPFLTTGRFFRFVILNMVDGTRWTSDQLVARPLPTRRTTQTQNKRREISMPWAGFEPATPVLKRAKTVHVSDRPGTVNGEFIS